MHIYEDPAVERAGRGRVARRSGPSAEVFHGGVLRAPNQVLTPDRVLSLQRLAGNEAVQALLREPGPDRDTAGRTEGSPSIRVRDFGALPAGLAGPVPQVMTGDKSTDESTGEQDQSTSVGTFQTTAQGVKIVIDGQGCFTSEEFPDGFRWTQVIDTNAPLHGASPPYVDPYPNDDSKPFYWTDAEEAASPCQFRDAPSRNAPATGTTTWQATLGLNGVNEATKTVQGFAYLTYGFTLDTAGTVVSSAPVGTDGANHRSQLKAEFGDWTFS